MKGTYFNRLPNEVISLAINRVPDPEIFQTCQESFPELCDWNFWRDRARTRFDVPNSYFDLGLSRSIPGAYRYLEVLTQFHLVDSALVKIDQGLVSGIYTLDRLISLAVIRDQIDLVRELLPLTKKSPNIYLNETVDLYGYYWNLYPILTLTGGRYLRKYNTALALIKEKNWDQLISILTDGTRVKVCVYLVYIQEGINEVVKKLVDNFTEIEKSVITRAAVQIGNFDQFIYFWDKVSQTTKDNFLSGNGEYASSSNPNHVGSLHTDMHAYEDIQYSLLLDAYAGANLTIIAEVSSYNYKLPEGDFLGAYKLALNFMTAAREQNLSNPVAVYQVIDMLTLTKRFEYSAAVPLGIEVVQLIFSKFPDLSDVSSNFPARVQEIYGNIDLFAFLIQQLIGQGEGQHLERFVLSLRGKDRVIAKGYLGIK